jgi:hypothetical protein
MRQLVGVLNREDDVVCLLSFLRRGLMIAHHVKEAIGTTDITRFSDIQTSRFNGPYWLTASAVIGLGSVTQMSRAVTGGKHIEGIQSRAPLFRGESRWISWNTFDNSAKTIDSQQYSMKVS